MSSIRVRSYLDTNAPQYDGQDKRAFLKFMKAMFESPSYNARVVSTITVNSTAKTITVPTAGAPVFSVGNLLRITGTLSATFQSTYYRVVEASDSKLTLSISNYDTVAYPANDLSNSILLEHAPLDWEICYSTDTQFSIRSKDPTSSKTVLTVSEPKNPKLNTPPTAYANVCNVKVSKDITTGTGVLIDDLTSVTNARGTFSESLFFVWNHSSYYYSATLTGNVPWFIISSSKFVYLIIGSEQSARNFNRLSSTATYRDTFYFGDPDFIGDPSYIDYNGFIMKTDYSVNTDTSTSIGDNGGFTGKINVKYTGNSRVPSNSGYWMRPFEATGTDIEAITLLSLDGFNNTNSGGGTLLYPNAPSRGLLFFPIFVGNYTNTNNNIGNVIRSTLPFTLYCPNSLNNYTNNNFTNVDYTVLKTYDNKNILAIVTQASTTTINSSAFFELD